MKFNRKKKYIVSIWTPPLEEEFILNNLKDFNKYDMYNIINYQKHLSEDTINIIKMMLELNK
jgi:hypothetical protein